MEAKDMEEKIVILGGGIAGLATALALHRIGLPCLVLERAHELRATGAAVSLWPNAWRALHALRVEDKLVPLFWAIESGRFTELNTGEITEMNRGGLISRDGLRVRPVSRKTLLEVLASELPPATIRFGSKVSAIEKIQDSSRVKLHLEDGTIIKTKVLIGCDGIWSVVAQWLGLQSHVDSGRSAVRGLSSYPNGHKFKAEVIQYLDEGTRIGFVPLNNKEIYWFITSQARIKVSDIPKSPQVILKECLETLPEKLPSDPIDVVRHTELETLSEAPLMFRPPWDLYFKSLSKGNVTVAGDAMHLMTPELGQGGCSALEDAIVLARNLGEAIVKDGKFVFDDKAIEGGLAKYVEERRGRGAQLITGSYVSGWAQTATGWFSTFIRDKVFYKFVFKHLLKVMEYDCGKLPPHNARC